MKDWAIEDFVTYLYTLAVNADFQADAVELALAEELAGNLLKKHFAIYPFSFEKSFNKIQSSRGTSWLNFKEILKEEIHAFNFSDEIKSDFIKDLKLIMNADNKMTPSETEIFLFMRMLFEADRLNVS